MCLKLRHVLEVHSVDPRDSGGHGGYRGPGSKLSGDDALPLLLEKVACLEDLGDHVLYPCGHALDPANMVMNVLEVLLRFGIHAW